MNAAEPVIKTNPAGKVYVLPNIAGFVGADTIGVILATDYQSSEISWPLISKWRNGAGYKDRVLACSTAAGPHLKEHRSVADAWHSRRHRYCAVG